MSAQELYITGLLESFSTFCEQNGVPSVVFQEAQLGLVSLLKSVQTKNWHLNDTGKFLLEFDKNTQVSPVAKALVIQFVKDYPPLQTAVFLRQYLLALTNNGCSQSTVKNYRSDINQFFVFCKNNDLELIFVKPKALSFLRKEQTDNASSATLKRKLSSLTQFGNWLTDIGFFKPGQIKWLIDLNRNPHFEKEISESKIATNTQNTPDHPGEASRLLSLTRLLPRMRAGTHAGSQASLQAGLQGFSAGLSRAASGLSSYTSPKHQEHNHQLRTSLQELQSKINKRTNQWLFSYINVAFIALFAIGLSYFGYMQFFVQPPATQAFPTSLTRPNRTLSFQGRLTDTAQNPVTAATNFRFRLYDSGPSTVGGTSLWDSGTCSVTPDQDGIFSTGLGTDCGAEIDSSVFSENANVWLQVEVAGETLSPRQSIKSVAYALNSETLQGYPPADPATANTVLVMNSSGEVSLGTSAPKIKASTGTLTLEGTTVTLQTTSNGNIALSPNGTGNVIASRYFSAPGATFSATYAGGTALVTRGGPSGTANIQEWQNNGGSALSIVNSAGNFGIGTTTTRAALDVNGDASTSGSLVFRGSSPATLDVLNGSRFDFQNSPGGDAGLVARLSILLNGNVGIGTTNPSGKLQITGDEVRIGSAGTINFATGDGDLYVQDYLEVDGTINGTSILQNGNTVCDASGNCTNSGLWQNTNNAFHPRNEWAGVADVLIGGSATASAKFGFINVAAGSPTATISGNLSIVTPTGSAPSTTYNVLNGGSFNLRTSVGGDANLTSRLFVSNSGNVGVGTATPTQSLDVSGDLRLRGNDITDSSDTTRLSVGATTTLTNTTTVLSGTATLTASSLATMTTSSSVNWGGATSLTFTADNASIYGSDSANGDLTLEGTSSGTKTSSYVLLQPNGGNVGIGSITPGMALDVQGDSAAHFQARFRNPTNGIGNITAGSYSALGETYSSRSTLVGNNVYADTVNTVGDQLLYRNTHASYGHAALLMSGGDIKFYNKTESVTAGAVVTKNLTMIIDGDNGNVGIGTATPSQLLHVQGNARVTGAYYDSSNSAGTTGYLMLSTGTGTAWTNPESLNDLGWWDNTANVLHPRGANAGVVDFALGGTSTASAKFAVINMATGTPTATMSGNLSLITPTGAAPATTYNVLNGGTFNLRTSVGGDADLTSRIFVANAGNVGVGTTSPTQKLDVNGDLRVRGNDITDSGDATRITLGATTTLTNTTTTLSGTSTLTASSLATITTSTDVDWGGIDNLVFTGDNTTIYGSDSSGGDLTLEGTSNVTKTASNVLLQPNGGNVGIGTTAAGSALLQVFGAADQLRLAYDISNYTQFSGKSNGDMHMDPTGALYLNGTYTASNSFIVGSTGALTLNSAADSSFTGAGNVGVGTASSISQKLHVQGNLRVTGAYYDSANSPGSNGYLMLSTGSGTAWTNPDALLDLGWWDNTGNVLHPRNEYAGVVDLVVGGNSTASADFRVQGQDAVGGTLAGYTYGRRFLDIDDSTYYVEPGNTTTAGLFASNVGIGTTGASVRLHSVATTEQLRLGYNASNYSSFTVGSTGALTLAQTGTGGAINLNSSLASGGTTTAALNLKTTTDLGTNDEVFQVGDSAADFFTIRGNGNIGVGTTAPSQVLDVNGDLRVRGNDITDSGDATRVSLGATTTLTNTTTTLSGTTTLTASSLATMTTSSTVAWGGATALTFTADNAMISGSDVANGNLSLQGTTNATRTTSYVLLQPNGGNVAIGTTTPLALLDVAGTASVSGTVSVGNNSASVIQPAAGANLTFNYKSAANTWAAGATLQNTTGNFGIGTTNPSQLLHVAGNMRLSGAFRDSGDTPGTLGQILTSTVTGTAWADPDTVYDTGWWDNTAEVIHPRNEYAAVADLVIGGNSTASADFRVQGQNAVSGTLAGYTYGRRFLDIDDSTYYVEPGDTTTAASFNGDILLGGADQIDFSDNSEDKVYWFSNTYGTGIESGTLTNWANTRHRWRIGGTSTSTGTQAMSLTSTGLALGSGDASYTLDVTGNIRNTTDAFLATTGANNVGIGQTSAATKLDIDTNSNTLGLRLRGTAETTEIADIFVGAGGRLALSTANTGGASGYIEVDAEDDQYGLVLRDSDTGSTQYANFYMNDATTDYLNIVVNNTNASTGIVVQSGGNVGVGTTAPGALFAVGANSDFLVSSAGNITEIGNVAHSISNSSGALLINANSAANIQLQTAGGSVGIGTTTISAKLHTLSTTEQLRLGYDASNYSAFTVNSGGDLTVAPSGGDAHITGTLDVSSRAAIGSGAAVGSTVALRLQESFAVDDTTYQLYSNPTITSPTLTVDRTSYGSHFDVVAAQTEDVVGGFDSTTIGNYSRVRSTTGSTFTFANLYGTQSIASNNADTASDLGGLYGAYNEAQQLSASSTIPSVIGTQSIARGSTGASTGSTITNAYGSYNLIYPYNTAIGTAFGMRSLIQTIDAYTGDIDTAYGVYSSVQNASDDGAAITTGVGGAFIVNRSTGLMPLFTTATGLSSNVADATTAYALDLTATDTDTVTAYGMRVNVSGATANNYGIWGEAGDWILDQDGNGTAGGTGSGGDIVLGEGQDLEIYHDGTNSFIANNTGDFKINTTSDLVLQESSGSVGIGTAAPSDTLDVNGTARVRTLGAAQSTLLCVSGTGVISSCTGGSGGIIDGSGTTNYLARWTDGDTLGIGATFDNGTNVGIGTSVPLAKLDVTGTASVSGTLSVGNNSASVIQPAAGANLTFNYKSAANTWAAGATLQNTTGNFGIGTTNPTQVLDVNGDIRVRGNDITDSADAIRVSLGATTTLTNTTTTLSGTTTLTASSLSTFTTSATLAMNSTSTLNATSLANLTTASTVAWGGATALTFTADNAMISGSDVANGNLSLQGTTNATRTTSYVLLQPNGGNVGIGTVTPTQVLDVNGDIRVRGNDITDSADAIRVSLGATTTLTNTTTTLSGTTTLTASSLATFTTSATLAMNSTSTLNATSLANLTTASTVAWGGATALTFTADNAMISGSDVANGNLSLQGTTNATRTTSYVLLQPNGGNVAIGTTTPLALLDVAGTASASGTVTVGDNSASVIRPAAGADLTLNYKSAANTWAAGATLQNTTGNFGIGTTNPGFTLDVDGQIRSVGATTFIKSVQSGGGGAYSQGIVDTDNSFARAVFSHNAYWDSSTNLWNGEALGANDMQAMLVPNNGGFQFITHASTANASRTMDHATFTAGTKMTILNGGSVGIGTTGPSDTLDVNGTARVRTLGAAQSTHLCVSGTGVLSSCTAGTIDGTGIANYVARWLDTDTITTGVLYDNGTNVGVGTTVPLALLDVAGTASASGTVTIGDNSSSVLRPAAGANMTLQYKSAANTWANGITLQNTTGNVGIGAAVTNPAGGLDIANGSNTLVLGADTLANTRTNTTTKQVRIGNYHYTNSAVPSTIIFGQSTSTSNNVGIGGGTSTMNAATQLDFYTGATTTTTTGTSRMTILAGGNVGVGTSNPVHLFEINGAAATAVNGIGLGTSGTIDTEIYRSAANTLSLATGDSLNLVSGNYSQVTPVTTGTGTTAGHYITNSTVTSGNIFDMTSTATAISSGKVLNISKTGASGSTAFTGDIASIAYSHTFNGGVGLASTGNVADITRAITLNNSGNTHTISGAVMSIADTMTQTAGTLTHTASVLDVTQNYTTSTGNALYLKNYGNGNALRVDDASGDTTPFIIAANGNVGIGTTSASNVLDVNGTARIRTFGSATTTGVCTDVNGVLSSCTNFLTGSGTTNYVARWTSSNTLGTGAIFDNGTDAAIGGTNVESKLFVSDPLESNNKRTITASSTSTAVNAGVYNIKSELSHATTLSGGNPLGLNGIHSEVTKTGTDSTSGTIDLYGIRSTSTYSVSSNTGGGQRNLYGGRFTATNTSGGTNMTSYGVYAEASGSNTNYGIYSASGSNYFNGNVGIGSTSPGATLDVVSSVAYPTAGIRLQTSAADGNLALVNTGTSGRDWRLITTNSGSGAGGGVLRFFDGTAGADRMSINASGNVGIGTFSGGSPLHINSTAQSALQFGLSSYYIGSLSGTDPLINFDANDYILYNRAADTLAFSVGNTQQLTMSSSTVNLGSDYQFSTNDNCTGMTTPCFRTNGDYLVINPDASNLYLSWDSGTTNSIYFQNTNNYIIGGNRVVWGGNGAGYDTTSATVPMSFGNISQDYPANSGWASTWASNLLLTGSEYATISFHDASDTVGTLGHVDNTFFFDGGGSWGPVNVGINTRAPSARLEISDLTNGTSNKSALEVDSENSTAITGTGTYNQIGMDVNVDKTGTDTTSGITTVVGVQAWATQNSSGTGTKNTWGVYGSAIGNTLGTATTYGVYGNAQNGDSNYGVYCFASGGTVNGCGGNQNWVNYSDRRIKRDINTVVGATNIVKALRGVTYYRTDDGSTRRQVGFIAQEANEVLPEVVIYDATKDMYSMEYSSITAVLVEAFKEQDLKVEGMRFTADGDLLIQGSNQNYTVTQVSNNSPITAMLTAAQLVGAKIKAGFITTQELVVEQSASISSLSVTNLTVAGQSIQAYIAGIVQSQMNSTSPQIATGSAQIANLTSEEIITDNLTTTDASISGSLSTDIAMIDELSTTNITATGTTSLGALMAQTATISGTLTAENLEVAGSTRLAILEAQQATLGDIRAQTADLMNATVSGTLYAENIYDLNGKIAAALQQPSIMDIITNNLPEPLPEADPVSVYDSVESAGYTINPDMLAITGSEISFADGDVLLTAQAAYVEKYLQVNGLAYIAQSLGVGEDIILGTTTTISDRSLAFTPTTAEDSIFYFQPSGLGKLDFLAGTMTIESGAVAINGSLNVAGTTKTETLLTNLIQPADFGNPFQVQVAGASSQSGEIKKSRFEIINELGTPVATISAEGKANFAGGIGIGSETLNPADVASGSSATVSTNKTSGKARLQAGVNQITIEAEQITEGSLVYVTPVGSTQNQVLYVKSQTAENPATSEKEGKFVVGFDQAIGADVNFNWWIVN